MLSIRPLFIGLGAIFYPAQVESSFPSNSLQNTPSDY
jgi:hypothetical protein